MWPDQAILAPELFGERGILMTSMEENYTKLLAEVRANLKRAKKAAKSLQDAPARYRRLETATNVLLLAKEASERLVVGLEASAECASEFPEDV